MTDPHLNSDFWKRKLAAYLHDPPSKCMDIRGHEEHARRLYRQAGFVDEEEIRRLSDTYAKPSDWMASSADRFPFPRSHDNLSSVFDGIRAPFHHPLSPGQLFKFHKEFPSVEKALEVEETVQPVAKEIEGWTPEEQWKARFFSHWRLWEKFCTEKDYRFAFLPADTRLPDHSVWTHMQVVSALDGCSDGTGKDARVRPAFLKFQLGPVQDFIAEARSVRDLWSGSYLLSWLMAAGMKALALEVGPDSVVYPNLKGQPIFDLHLRDPLWTQITVNEKPVWEHLDHQKEDILTPNLPNVFLAVVHRDRAEDLAKTVESAIRAEWQRIAGSVWNFCEKAKMIPAEEAGFTAEQRKTRFDAQVKRFLSLGWQATPWPETLDQALTLADSFNEGMPVQTAADRVRAIVCHATQKMPAADRDARYYADTEKTKLNSIGLGWSIILAFNGWQLDAVRQTRSFDAWSGGRWDTGTFSNKDSLGGKAEAVAGGREWCRAAENKGEWKSLFKLKHQDWIGASTLIKRLWHLAYLRDELGLETDSKSFPMPQTHGIAAHDPFSDDDHPEPEAGEKYFAVLALDGDQIGKWVSGEKTPAFKSQFSDYLDGSAAQRQGALRYFEENDGNSLLEKPRALSPSYHLQFSQALSNFALLCARSIVEAHDGRLIYAGGDDVLAMLPADTALECAQALRATFQGDSTIKTGLRELAAKLKASHDAAKPPRKISPALSKAASGTLLNDTLPGYLSINKDQTGHPVAFVVPGPAADVSVGIAIAHFKSPLQDVVRAAQAAEKRAKNQLGRGAVAVSLFKRSGEITEWGAKWNSGGLALYEAIAQKLSDSSLTARFPHRVCQLLEPYLVESSPLMKKSQTMHDAHGFDASAIIRQEFPFAVSRQSAPGKTKDNETTLLPLLDTYLGNLKDSEYNPQTLLTALIGLCATVAFAHRTKN